MSDIRTAIQFSVFLVNKPGILAQVTQALADEKVNIVAMTLVDSQEHGVLRLVGEEPKIARAVLAKLNLPMTETEVLCVDLPNQAGRWRKWRRCWGRIISTSITRIAQAARPAGEQRGCSKRAIRPRRSICWEKVGKRIRRPDLHRGRGRR